MRKVFISSTIVSLGGYRRAAARSVRELRLMPVRLETLWPNRKVSDRTSELAERVAAEVASCDAFIRIDAGRKGMRINGTERTFLELELDAALTSRLPVFFYAHPQSTLFSRLYHDEVLEREVSFLAQCVAIGATESESDLYEKVRRDVGRWLNATHCDRSVVVLPRVSPVFVRRLLADPKELARCPDRLFEELIADLLSADGWEVALIARSNAKGPDIIACTTLKTYEQPIRMVVECKRYSETNRVDVREVRNLVYWLNEEYRATLGMIATSSTFTRDALAAVEEHHRWRLNLRDQNQIIRWLAGSGVAGSDLQPANTSLHRIPGLSPRYR